MESVENKIPCFGNNIFINGEVGINKCLGEDTLILLSNGKIENIKNIKPGDSIMGGKTSIEVKSIYHGFDDLFKVNINGHYFIVNKEYKISFIRIKTVDFLPNNNYNVSWGDNTGLIQNRLLYSYEEAVNFYNSIPEINNISILNCLYKTKDEIWKYYFKKIYMHSNIPEDALDFDPYLFGLWLADNQHVTGLSDKYMDFLNKKLRKYDLKLFSSSSGEIVLNQFDQINKNIQHPFITFLKKHKLCFKKYIPDTFKNSSINSKLELLSGLIRYSTQISNKFYIIAHRNINIINDVIEIIKSIGLFNINVETCSNGNGCGFIYKIGVYDQLEILNSTEIYGIFNQAYNIDIEYLGQGKFYCIN